MHGEALAWVAHYSKQCGDPASVLDLGGRDVNGSPRPFFGTAEYVTLDILPGADITANAATWKPDRQYDAVVCTEVFEHTAEWPAILKTAFAACKPGGRLIVTCAGPGRAEHSGHDGQGLRAGEWYANVSVAEMDRGLRDAGWTVLASEEFGQDTRAFAEKPAKR